MERLKIGRILKKRKSVMEIREPRSVRTMTHRLGRVIRTGPRLGSMPEWNA